MNTIHNKRQKDSQKKIEKVFVELLQLNEIGEIKITDICKKADLNRTTFYNNYTDIYDLADCVKKKLEEDIRDLYKDEEENKYNSNNFLKLFQHIKDNRLFYKTYFKLGFDTNYIITKYDTNEALKYFNNESIEYHLEFFRYGLNAMIKMWLKRDCLESPREMNEILKSEYQKDLK